MGYLSKRQVDATFEAMQRHLQLVEEYSYFQGTTSYDIRITMGDSAFSMMFRPAGNIPLDDMRARTVRIISKNIVDIHDSTCACIADIKESMHTIEKLGPEPLRLVDEDYN